MKLKVILPLVVSVAGISLLTGCGSTSAYVDPKGPNTIVSVDKINIQDFAKASDKMVQSLIDNVINQNKLKSSDPNGGPALMAISKFVNSTASQLEMDQLTKNIRVSLSRTGKIQTYITENLGNAEDPLANKQKNLQDFLNDGQPKRRPDYTLSGKIIEDRASSGRLKQNCYIFQLSLTAGGIAVWEEQETICKQGTRPSVGF